MPYSAHGILVGKGNPIVRLPSFLEDVREPHDLLNLLDRPLMVNPSDLFAIVDCETRLRAYSGDRTVSAAIFFIDLRQDLSFRLDSEECEEEMKDVFRWIVCATIEHYQKPGHGMAYLARALSQSSQLSCRELLHDCFERKFRDWRQMIRTARRTKQSSLIDHSCEYGALSMGVVVADRIGNMLCHVRHHYCDVAFSGERFTLE